MVQCVCQYSQHSGGWEENHEIDCGQLGLHSETLSEATYMGLEYEYPKVLSGNYKGIFKINTLEGKPF